MLKEKNKYNEGKTKRMFVEVSGVIRPLLVWMGKLRVQCKKMVKLLQVRS